MQKKWPHFKFAAANMNNNVFFFFFCSFLVASGSFLEEMDPCLNVLCEAGRECVLDQDTNLAKCECIKECGYESDPRRMVCSNHNETFKSDCEVHQLRCFCEEGRGALCSEPDKYKHVHVEYFGECQGIPQCDAGDLEDFPRRMREWLFNVMEELSGRFQLSSRFEDLHTEAKFDMSKKWAAAAVWKWCDLDKHPHDNVVSRHELFPVRAPLKALEHCIGDFLDSCDSNQDHEISFQEWAKCLDLEVDELEAKCDDL